MTLYFISDIHLSENQPHLTTLFETFLHHHLSNASALYIVGDLFAYWIGDDVQSDYQKQICALIKTVSDNLPVYVMHGNRDFLLGKTFASNSGCQFIPDPHVIHYGEQTILLCHGDSLCLEDTAHQRFRRLSRLSWLQTCFLTLPKAWRVGIANKIRNVSAKRVTTLPAPVMDITLSELPRLTKLFQCDVILHGHTHQPSIHWFRLDDRWYQHWVLSDWTQQGNYLRLDPIGHFELGYF